MGMIFHCSVRFLNTILPYKFLITGFWKKSNENSIKTFEFNLWKKSSKDQDIQSAHKDIKKSFSYILFVCIISNESLIQIDSFSSISLLFN